MEKPISSQTTRLPSSNTGSPNKQQKARKADGLVLIVRIALVVILVLAWEMASRAESFNAFYTSYPSAIIRDLYDFFISGDLAHHASITLKEALTGLLFGSVAGVSLGVLLSQFRFVGRVLTPIISAVGGIPQLTLSPLYILWFGVGFQSKVVLSALMVFFGVFSATYNAIKNLDQKWIEAANLLGANSLQTLTKVVIPASSPWILSGIRGGIGACMVGAIMGEMMGAAGGFGWMISFASAYFNIKRVLACVLLLMLFNLALNAVLNRLEKRLLYWRQETKLSLGASE